MARMCPDCGTGIVRKRRNADEYACTGCGQKFVQTKLFEGDEWNGNAGKGTGKDVQTAKDGYEADR